MLQNKLHVEKTCTQVYRGKLVLLQKVTNGLKHFILIDLWHYLSYYSFIHSLIFPYMYLTLLRTAHLSLHTHHVTKLHNVCGVIAVSSYCKYRFLWILPKMPR